MVAPQINGRGLGLLRPDPAKYAHRVSFAFHGAVFGQSAPKGAATLVPAPRLDQGATGTCHSHSACGAVWCAFTAAGQSPTLGSPLSLASCTYGDVRAGLVPPGLPLPPLMDTGADLSDDAKAMAKWGLPPMGPNVEGRHSDVPNDEPGVPFPEPDEAKLQIASKNLIDGEYQIPIDANAPRLCALALDAGIPIWVGFFVDSAFEALGPNDVAQAPNTSDTSGGGHAVYLSGYRTAADGTYEFRLENSWGPGWCDGGACWVSEAWLKACWMLWPMTVKVTS